MKLQELLTKHKDKLWDWLGELIIDLKARENYQIIVIDLRINDKPTAAFSLADLLFDTPFLSLLEWDDNKCDKIWIHQYMKWWKFVEWYSIYEQYHKINLALLTTDQERIIYLEENTI